MRIPTGLVTTCVLAFAAGANAQEPPRIGTPFEPPAATPTKGPTYGLLSAPAQCRIATNYVLAIEFDTTEPTPPARIYYGLNTLDEDLDWPRYRDSAQEDGAPGELRTEHRIAVHFGMLLARIPNTEYEPRIVWRAEVWLPSQRSSRFVEGRAYFDPKDGSDVTNIVRGPFVDLVDATSALISWDTDRPADAAIHLGGRVVRRTGATTHHEVRVDGLVADTTYEYRVVTGGTAVRPYAFRTAGDGPFRFGAMVDSREGVGGGLRNFGGVEAHSLRLLSNVAYRRGAALILFPGDLINGYTTGVDDFQMQLDAFRQALAPVHARIPIYEGMGNHESLVDLWASLKHGLVYSDKTGDDSAEAVFGRTFVNPTNGPKDEGAGSPAYAENVYWFDRGNTRFVVLNNNYWWSSDPHRLGGNLEGYILPAQMAWLRSTVAAADADESIEHLFVAAQEPPFPNGGHSADAMWHSGGDTNKDGKVDAADIGITQNRNEMWQIIAGSAKTVCFITGDEHAYSRTLIDVDTPVGPRALPDGSEARFAHPVWQVTSGGAGAPWYDKELHLPWSGSMRMHSTQPHVALFEVDGGDVSLQVFSQTGQELDAVVLRTGGKNRTD